MSKALDNQVKKEIEFEEKLLNEVLSGEYRKSLIRLGRSYIAAIKIVEQFCKSFPMIDKRLNNYYIQIFEDIEAIINKIHGDLDRRMEKNQLPSDYVEAEIFKKIYYRPFKNFYSAEADLDRAGISSSTNEPNWPEIRKRMNNFVGHIKSIFEFGDRQPFDKSIAKDLIKRR